MENSSREIDEIGDAMLDEADAENMALKARKKDVKIRRKSNRRVSGGDVKHEALHHLPEVQHGHASTTGPSLPIRRDHPRGR